MASRAAANFVASTAVPHALKRRRFRASLPPSKVRWEPGLVSLKPSSFLEYMKMSETVFIYVRYCCEGRERPSYVTNLVSFEFPEEWPSRLIRRCRQ